MAHFGNNKQPQKVATPSYTSSCGVVCYFDTHRIIFILFGKTGVQSDFGGHWRTPVQEAG